LEGKKIQLAYSGSGLLLLISGSSNFRIRRFGASLQQLAPGSSMDTAFLSPPLARNLVYDEFAVLHPTSYPFHTLRYLRCNPMYSRPLLTIAPASPSRVCSSRSCFTYIVRYTLTPGANSKACDLIPQLLCRA
jgi:hypothetical protein